MNVPEAIAHLEMRAMTALQLADAADKGEGRPATTISKRNRLLAEAIAIVLAVVPEGAK